MCPQYKVPSEKNFLVAKLQWLREDVETNRTESTKSDKSNKWMSGAKYLAKAVNGNIETHKSDTIITRMCLLPTNIMVNQDKVAAKENLLFCVEAINESLLKVDLNKYFFARRKHIFLKAKRVDSGSDKKDIHQIQGKAVDSCMVYTDENDKN